MGKKRKNKTFHPNNHIRPFNKTVKYDPPKRESVKVDKTPLRELYPDAILVDDWDELKALNLENDDYYVEIDRESCCGWIKKKNNEDHEYPYYLSTHSFYGFTDSRFGGTYRASTKALQARS